MGRRLGRRRLAWAVALVTLAASVSAGLLRAAERGGSASQTPAARAGQGSGGTAESAGAPSGLSQEEATGGIEIVAPDSNAKLRGVAAVQAQWPDSSGYVIFRVDGQFAYATTEPYRMRWDTSTSSDGSHVIRADAYDEAGEFAGSSSVKVQVENVIPTPEDGVLLTVRFSEAEVLERVITARGEVSALRADQVMPEGFEVLSGELRAEVTQNVLDTSYEGVSALIRSRLRSSSLVAHGSKRPVPEVGQYAMIQVSRNGLTIPVASGTSRPRIGLGEISLALADYPVAPGDTWESPLGVVCDLYSRRAIYVQGEHTFEGLRWFRGRECAVITSTYTVPSVPLLERAAGATAVARAGDAGRYQVALTQMMGGGMRGGMRGSGAGMRGGMAGGMMGRAGMRGGVTARPGARQAQPGAAAPGGVARPGPTVLDRARLVNLEGERQTYVTRETGRVMYTEDTLRGKVDFRAAAATTGATPRTSARLSDGYSVRLTAMMGGGMRGGGARGGGAMRGGGARGGMMGGGMRGGMMAGGMRRGAMAMPGAAGMRGTAAQRAPGATAAGRPAAEGARQIPPSLDYALRITTELATR